MKKYFFAILFCLCGYLAFAQNEMLQKKISVDFRNITMYDALIQIERQAGFYFSYDNQFIKNQKKLSFVAHDQTVKEVLDRILDKEYQYIVNRNKVVIRKKQQQEYITVQGSFFDQTDQRPIEYATVYEPTLKIGTMSNQQGRFSLNLPPHSEGRLLVSRISYQDTSFQVAVDRNTTVTIGLAPFVRTEEPVTIRSVERHWLARTVIGTKQRFSTLNLRDYFYQRKFQIGFWPGIGTKAALKGQQENKISFNVFGGYAAQVDALEIGGLFNIVQKHVRSFQVAGLFNVVGASVDGVQLAGLYNYSGGDVNALQVGGLVNSNQGNTRGLQLGGIYNRTKRFSGLQIGGVLNQTGQFDRGMQIGGIVSKTDSFQSGAQLSGLVNVAGRIRGAQVGGLVNIAKSMHGFQLGFLNLADTLNGLAIGPFNYSRNGKHALSASFQENGQWNLSYKSGDFRLYNILQAGILNTDRGSHFLFGYGLGREWALKSRFRIATELVSLYYSTAKSFEKDYSTLALQPFLLYQLRPKIQLFAGPRLQYQLPLHQPGTAGYPSFHRNMIPLIKGEKDGLYLGLSLGVNIF